MTKSIMILLGLSISVLAQETYYYKNYKKEPLIPIETKQTQSRSIKPMQYYKNAEGVVMGVGQKLIVKIEDNASLSSYLAKYNVTMVRKLSHKLYLLRNNSTQNTLHIANQLTEEGGIVYAQPDFIKKIIRR